MTDLLKQLYSFTLEQMDQSGGDPEYESFCRCARQQEARLRAALDDRGRTALDDMLYELQCRHSAELEALFQASIALCRELSGLVWPKGL